MFLKGMNGLGMNLTERNFPIITENYLVMWGMVKGGLGIGVQDSLIGDAEPLVRRVLPDLEPLIFSMWLVTHPVGACASFMIFWRVSLKDCDRAPAKVG
jgi:hypothetical protein